LIPLEEIPLPNSFATVLPAGKWKNKHPHQNLWKLCAEIRKGRKSYQHESS
jgi:hypothetical protein